MPKTYVRRPDGTFAATSVPIDSSLALAGVAADADRQTGDGEHDS